MGFSWRTEPEEKDHRRIDDIINKKAVGDKAKQEKLAHQQAKLIEDPYKALRRGRAAIDAKAYDLAKIFFQKVIDLKMEKLLDQEDKAAMEGISKMYDWGIFF
jgi:hypothetical protein